MWIQKPDGRGAGGLRSTLPGVGVLCDHTYPGVNPVGRGARYGVQIVMRLSDSIPPSPPNLHDPRAGS